MKEPKINYEEEIKKCKTMDDVVGKNGLMQKLLKDVMQQLLEAEMDEHLGREKYERSNIDDEVNYRNGHSSKLVRSSYGEVPIDIPRDRQAKFEPKAIRKYEKDCNEFDKKIIGLYARGMSTRDIQSEYVWELIWKVIKISLGFGLVKLKVLNSGLVFVTI